MTAGHDWIFHTLAAILGLLGLWLLYWSLFKDRARGRRRCPKCWYDLSGTPGSLRCSECGFVAKRERRFFRTRRRWTGALAALLLATMGAATAMTPRVQRDGWYAIAPNTILILLMPKLETSHPKAFSELQARMDAGALSQWQWKWLLRRCLIAQRQPWQFKLSAPSSGPNAPGIGAKLTFQAPSLAIPWLSNSILRARLRQDRAPHMDAVIIQAGRSVSLPTLCTRAGVGDLRPEIIDGERCLNFVVEIQREMRSFVPPPATGPAKGSVPTPRTSLGWTTIAAFRQSLALNDLRVFERLRSHADDNLTRQIQIRSGFQLNNRELSIDQRFGYASAFAYVACPVEITLLHGDQETATWTDWWELTPAVDAARYRSYRLPGFLQESINLTDRRWSLRIRGDSTLALWSNGDYWAGEFSLHLAPARAVNGEAVLQCAPDIDRIQAP